MDGHGDNSVETGLNCQLGQEIVLSAASRLAQGPTQPPALWAVEVVSLGVKWLGHEANHSPPSNAEVRKAWSYTFIPPYTFMMWCLIIYYHELIIKHRDNLTIYIYFFHPSHHTHFNYTFILLFLRFF
jgi:hypothetical protein